MNWKTVVLILTCVVLLAAIVLLAGISLSALRPINGGSGNQVIADVPTGTPSLTPSATPTATLPVRVPTPHAQTLQPTPSIPAGASAFNFVADPQSSGWGLNDQTRPNWGDINLNAGFYKGQTFQSLLSFDLTALPPGSKVLFADLELTGLNRDFVTSKGNWSVDLLTSDLFSAWNDHTSAQFYKAPALSRLVTLNPADVAADAVNQIVFAPAGQRALEQIIDQTGHATFRLTGPTGPEDNLFTWQGPGSTDTTIRPVASTGITTPTPTATPGGATLVPVLRVIAIPGSYSVVPFGGTPTNVLTAAARQETATVFAAQFGTPTPYPRNVATATPIIVVTGQPTPMNVETSVYLSQYATAVAMTTGTLTPIPVNWVTATEVPPTLTFTPTQRPTSTNTPTAFPLSTLTPFATLASLPNPLVLLQTPVPTFMDGNIIYQSNHFSPSQLTLEPVLMTPGGALTAIQPSGPDFYTLAFAREPFSPDHKRRVVVAADSSGVLQIWIADAYSNLESLVTRLAPGAGFIPEAYDPVWSPDGSKILYVSTETQFTEIYSYDLGTHVQTQLTHSGGIVTYNQHPSWSPDGRFIVFKSNRTGHFQIWIMNADGSSQRVLSPSEYDDENPIWVK